MTELFRALAVLLEPPAPPTARVAEALGLPGPSGADYTELFLFQLYPYASVYTGADGMLGGEARDRVAGFWRALGLTPPAEPDHLAALLGMYAELGDREAAAATGDARGAWRRARAALLWEHLLSWLPPYLGKLADAQVAPWDGWARIATQALADEAQVIGPPARLPLHLREAPALPALSGGLEEWIGAFLTPVRTGIILTRADLARAARQLDLSLRAGERRFALRILLDQDGPAVLDWLQQETVRWSTRHRDAPACLAPVLGFWAGRAGRLAQSLVALRRMKETAHAGSTDRQAD